MLKSVFLAASTAVAVAIVAIAVSPQNAVGQAAVAPVDKALFDAGQKLYATNCAACHQANGMGMPADLPQLIDNARLADLGAIVRNVHVGQGPMPAFPDLKADDIAAVATYARNAWTNKFGGVTPAQVTAALDALAKAPPQLSIYDGVYTEAQAMRGQTVYSANCAKCHGRSGNGAGEPDMPKSPPLARVSFQRKWDGRSVASLFAYIKQAMPQDNPGSRTDQEFIDAIAHMFSLGGLPAGSKDLPADVGALTSIVIKQMK